jgi:hypothetical protein
LKSTIIKVLRSETPERVLKLNLVDLL